MIFPTFVFLNNNLTLKGTIRLEMRTPILSIITVNLNNNTGLKKTIESIKQQSYADYEHLIIDGGSTDESKTTIEKYEKENSRLTYWVSEPDKGIYDGMNKGIKQAKGEYLYFLNSGDCLQSDILGQIPFNGTTQYIYGDMLLIEEKGEQERIAPDYPTMHFFFYDSLSHQSCFIHHSLFTYKLYDTRYKIISDWAHSLQAIIMENCSYQHLPFIISRCDGNGISSSYIHVQSERLKWLKENLSEPLYNIILDSIEYNASYFKPLIPRMNLSNHFQKRAFKFVKIWLKIHSFFSRHKKSPEDFNKILYYPPRNLSL